MTRQGSTASSSTTSSFRTSGVRRGDRARCRRACAPPSTKRPCASGASTKPASIGEFAIDTAPGVQLRPHAAGDSARGTVRARRLRAVALDRVDAGHSCRACRLRRRRPVHAAARDGTADPGGAVRRTTLWHPPRLQAGRRAGDCGDGVRHGVACPRCDKLFGPGNAFVTEAKRQVSMIEARRRDRYARRAVRGAGDRRRRRESCLRRRRPAVAGGTRSRFAGRAHQRRRRDCSMQWRCRWRAQLATLPRAADRPAGAWHPRS